MFLRTYDKHKALPSLDINQNSEQGEKGSDVEQGGVEEHPNSGIPEGLEKHREYIQFWIKTKLLRVKK